MLSLEALRALHQIETKLLNAALLRTIKRRWLVVTGGTIAGSIHARRVVTENETADRGIHHNCNHGRWRCDDHPDARSKQNNWLYATYAANATVVASNAIVDSDHVEPSYNQQKGDCR